HPRRPRLEAGFEPAGFLRRVGREDRGPGGVRCSRADARSILQSMDARVVYTDLKPDPELPHAFRELSQLLGEAHIISLHVPLTSATGNLIDRQRLAMMRPGAILINTARGGLVEQAALLEALKSGHLGAAGLDVFATEPVADDEALLQLDNVVVAPHLSWLTTGTLDRSLKVAVENCRRLQAGEPLLHRVV